MRVHLFTCGGTIDKIYFDAASQFQVGEPGIGQVFAAAGVHCEYAVTPLMRKDSLDMDQADRAAIRCAVEACAASRILVTHGTDTMVETALALQGIPDKRIVLTGAMQPAVMRDTDAPFNLGFALGVLTSAPAEPGAVLVAMNGQAFDPRFARKNRQLGRFERRDASQASEG